MLKWKARKVVFEMAIKSSNVAARVEPEIKEEAEAILAQLGISASNGINMFYRQIILWRGLPFRPSVPASRPLSLDEMTKEEFDAKMARGLAQAKAGEGIPADDFFASLRQEVLQSYV
jgi:DNA-damage-inducible protein J